MQFKFHFVSPASSRKNLRKNINRAMEKVPRRFVATRKQLSDFDCSYCFGWRENESMSMSCRDNN